MKAPFEWQNVSVLTRSVVTEAKTMFSTYYYELDEAAKHQCKEKWDKVGLIDDPYVMQRQGNHCVNWQHWPRVEYYDCNHLVQMPSIYTSESLRAYKSLSGYKFCVNGWVSSVSYL